jgi:hypothetical protein
MGVLGMSMNDDELAKALGLLGYPGFAYLGAGEHVDPAGLLLDAIDQDDLDSRVREGLPWVARAVPDLNWGWLAVESERRVRQNRLGFIVALAAVSSPYLAVHEKLKAVAERIAEIRTDEWDTLCGGSMTKVERARVHSQSFPIAARWHIDSDLELGIHACPRVGESFEVRLERWRIMSPREVCGHLRIRPGDRVWMTLTESGVLMTSENFRPPEGA